jgi:hypothetical protein
MKNLPLFYQMRNKVSFLMILTLLCVSHVLNAQAPSQVFAKLSMQKVSVGQEQEYVKFMRETIKPVHMMRRAKGKLMHWILFKVHFHGADDAYNYVGVSYYTSWANTETNSLLADIKEANPQADPVAVFAKLRDLSTLTSQAVVYRAEAVEPRSPLPFKFIRLDYMKVKPGMNAAYLKTEREDWMPFHRASLESGQSSAWALWQVLFPSGTDAPFDYVTSNRFSTYAQVLEADYDQTFKKVSPGKDVNAIYDRTLKSRDLVKSELWEVVDMLN